MRFSHLGLLGVLLQASGTTARGTQSGPNLGPLYAGGMVYDDVNEEIYVTGISYSGLADQNVGGLSQPNCFVGKIDLNLWNWDDMFSIGDQGVLETCQTMLSVDESMLMILGDSEYGGIYSNSNMKMSGFAMAVDKSSFHDPIGGVTLMTSSADKVPYPVMGVAQDKEVYIVALTSTDSQLSAAGQQAGQYPNWISDQKYGSSLDMSIFKLSLQQQEFLGIPDGDMTFVPNWVQEFPMDLEPNQESAVPPRVYIGGLIIKNHEFLVVAGSTRGLGTAYGPAAGDDEDGFITFLSMETGQLLEGRKNNERIGSSEDDVISGICDDPTDPYSFYVVGATKGDIGGMGSENIQQGSLQGWVMKINAETISARWTVQWGAQWQDKPTIAYAQGCYVQGGVVYVTGVVEGGASMVNGQQVLQSQGGADIWVAQLDSNMGIVNWMKQIGSEGDDRIARNGGVKADAAGNAIIYGDTTGSLYRERSSDETYADVFVMYLDAEDGYFADYGQPVAPPTDPPSSPVAAPIQVQPDVPTEFNPVGIQLTGPRYAGGLVYDSGSDIAVITGAAYQGSGLSDCYVASVNLYSGELMSSSSFGDGSTPEECSAIDYSLSENLAYVVGGTVVGGFLTDRMAQDQVNPDTVQYGLIFQVTDQGYLQGAAINQEDIVQYPVAVVADPVYDYVYVASMGSDYSDQNDISGQSYPNLMGQGSPAYGNTWFTVVQGYAVTSTNAGGDIGVVLSEDWYHWFGVDQDQEVFTSGMTLAGNGDTLVVVGSTRGSGDAFGQKAGTDMDGFILKINPSTGELVSAEAERSSTRLDSLNQKDDWATNVCNDRFDNDAFYVVGASMGTVRELPDDQQPPEGTTHSFVAKVNLKSLTAEWLRHFTMRPGSSDVPASSSAFGCTVTYGDEGNLVYVAGVVEAGAVLDGADISSSNGMDDIYVAQLNGFDGSVNWVRQIGTPQNDGLAKGGGIDVDHQGNAIVFGETYGELFSAKMSAADAPDVFMLTMSKIDGSYKSPDPNASPPDQPQPMEPGNDDFTGGSGVLSDNIVALQTGPDVGPSFAGGMSYDRFSNAVYVTGATYGAFASPGGSATMESSCFFGAVSLPNLEWVDRETFGTSDVPEACNDVSMTEYDGNSAAIVVGTTEANGLLTQLGEGIPRKQFGFALDLTNAAGHYTLVGGALMDQLEVQYPIAVETFEKTVYIVSMVSTDKTVTPDYQQVMNKEYPNLTTGGVEKYGSLFAISLEKHTMDRSSGSYEDGVIEPSLKLDWRKPFETTDNEAVYVSGLITSLGGQALVVIGSTRGRDANKRMDGLMAKISPESGSFVIDDNGGRAVAYFSSSEDRDDWLFGACPDPDDPSVFYVVGATQGQMDDNLVRSQDDVTVHAVVSKIDANTLDPIWIKQISSTSAGGTDSKPAAAATISCDVIQGKNLMYVAGNVENGATIDYQDESTIKSAGNDDIFVAQLDTQSGEIRWLKQVGSNGNDRIARGGGVKADQNGNAVVFGDTDGSFYRERDGEANPRFSDIFLMVFEQNSGFYMPPIVGSPLEDSTGTPTEFYSSASSTKASGPKTVTFGIVALVLLIVAIIVVCLCRRKQKKKMETQKSSIFAYLQQFDVEDIDLRKSPPGGWHGTYLNKLAYGINKADMSGTADLDTNGYETAPLTHSSVVRDSLFMDTTSAPSLGYRDDIDSDGLDSDFEDLTPRTYEDRRENLGREII